MAHSFDSAPELVKKTLFCLPVGASVASFIAYGHAKQSAGRGQAKFGQGDIRGVLAPEAANDAKEKLEAAGAVIELA